MKSHHTVLLALAAGLLLADPAAAQVGKSPSVPGATEPARTVDLRPKFRRGQEVRLLAKIDNREIVTSPTLPGTRTPQPGTRPAGRAPAARPNTPATGTAPAPEPSAFLQEVGLLLRVTSVDPEKGATADLVFESFKLKGKTALGELDFDSTKKSSTPDDPIDEALRGVVGTTLEATFDRAGNITAVQPKRSSTAQGSDLSAMLSGVFTGGDLIKSLVGPVTGGTTSPERVRVGEKWNERSRMGAGGGEWNIDVTKTLRDVRGNIATIDIRGEIALDNASPGGPALGVNAQAPYSGTCEWDIERGMLKRLETALRVRSAAPTADVPQQTHESRVTITRVGG